MTALTLEQMLETEALLHRVARTGLDDWLKPDLTEAVTSSRTGEAEHAQILLRPMVMRDDHCQAAQGMLCRALRAKLVDEFGSKMVLFGANGTIKADSPDAALAISRRLSMMAATIRAHLINEPHRAWEMLAPCTTADRLIVMGFTAIMLNKVMAGDVEVDPDDVSDAASNDGLSE